MAALSRRDIEMIFRAETDKATRPIAALTKDVKTLRGALEDQIDMVKRGEASMDSLAAATNDLKKAQDELGTARSLLTSLNGQAKALDNAEQRLAGASAKYEDLAARMAAAEKPSKRLQQQFEASGRAQAAAAENLDRVRAETAAAREQIESIIGPIDNIGNAFREIATTSKEVGRGLAIVTQGADEAKTALAGMSAAQSKAAADKGFQQAGADAGLLQSQINYLSQFENRIELLAQAKRELQAQDAGFTAALTAQDAKVGAANVAELRRQFEATAAAAARMEQVTAFRQLAVDANAAVTDVSRFAVVEDTAAASSTRLATAITTILNPAKAALGTMDGLEAAITQAAAVMEGRGTKTAQEYNVALNALVEAGAGLGRIAQMFDAFKAAEANVANATTAFRAAQAEAQKLAHDLATVAVPTEEMARALKVAEANVETTGKAMQNQGEIAEGLARKLRAAGVEANDLAAAETRIAAAAHQAGAASSAIGGKLGGKGGLFGLTPTDATNLSYQINDIFTQLASGQSIFITLAQQGPQIWQIGGVKAFIGQLGPLLGLLGGVAGGLGLVAAGIAGVYKATSDNKDVQQAKAYMALLGEQGSLTAAQMGKASKAIQDTGVKAAEANASLQQFNEAGLNSSYLDSFIEACKNAAQVTGVDFKDAANLLTEALSGGYDQVVALNEKFPVLTDAEMEQIRAMYESGQADEARQLIFDRFTGKLADAAAQMNGPWSNAWDNLKGAAQRFGDYIGGALAGWLKNLRSYLDEAAIGVNYLLLRMRGLDHATAANAAVNNAGKAPTKAGAGGIAPQGPRSTPGGRQAIIEAEQDVKPKKQQTRAERVLAATQKARFDAQNKQYSNDEAARLADLAGKKAGAKYDEEAAARGAAAGRKAAAAQRRDENAAKALAARIASAEEQLQTALDSMGAKVAKTTSGTLQEELTMAASAVEREYAKLFRKIDDYAQLAGKGAKIGGMSIADYRAQVKANEQVLIQAAQLKVYEDRVNDVLKQRQALLADIEDKAARGEISPADAIKQTQEVTSKFDPLIANLTQAAVTFAQQIGGAKPSPEILAFIAKMQGIQQRQTGDNQGEVRDAANKNIGRQYSALNQILSERNSLVEAYNTQVQLGLMTEAEARAKSAAAYNASAAAITKQLAALRATVEMAKTLGTITPEAYAAWIAQMDLVGQQTDYLDPRFAQLKQGIEGMISDNAMAGVEKIAAALGGLLAGTKSLGSALADAGMAFLNFIGQTIVGIARLILQMLILDAVQKITGIPVFALLRVMGGVAPGGGSTPQNHNGGTIGSYSGGKQRTTRISFDPATLAAAPRYHSGTPSVGLKPNEQVSVLEKGEKVVTQEQQRQEAAAAKRGAAGNGRSLKQVLAFGDDQVAAAMAGAAGEDVTLTHLRKNVPLLKQWVSE